MFTLISSAAFLATIVLFGWYLVLVVLNEKKISVLLALGPLLGFISYLFLLNATSYFIPIGINFYIIWVLIAVVGAFLFFKSRRQKTEIDIPRSWLYILLITAGVAAIWAGFVASRGLFYDTIYTNHIPTAVTVAEGNFPIKNLESPGELLKYHYAPELFAAAVHRITGMPIWFAYDIQIALSVFFIFSILYLLARHLFGSHLAGYLVAVSGLYGGGLNYLYVFDGIKKMYAQFFGNQEINNLFSFIPQMIDGEIANPVIGTINHHYTAIGFPVLLAIIYLYIKLSDPATERRGALIVIGGVLLGFLGLTAETFFGVAIIVLAAYPAVLFFGKRGFSPEVLTAAKNYFLLILIAMPIVVLQGGLVSGFGQKSYLSSDFILFGKNPNLLPLSLESGWSGGAPVMKVLSWSFIKNFGLPLIFFLPAIIIIRKRIKFLLIFILFVFVSAAIPIFVYYDFPHELLRFFFLTILFLNIIFGLFLTHLLDRFAAKKRARRLIFVLFGLFILPGIIFEVAYSVVPLKKMEDIPHNFYYIKDYFSKPRKYTHELFARIPPPDMNDVSAFEWIKKNTGIDDVFFYPIARPIYYDTTIDFSKLKFVVFTGRLTPDYRYGGGYNIPPPRDCHLYNLARKNCSLDLLKDLGFNYIYVSPLWPAGLEEKCTKNGGLNKVYETAENGNFRRIYKIE